MKIAIGSDHGGFNLKSEIKKHLESKNIEVEDFGTHSLDPCDYPVYGEAVAKAVSSGRCDLGILLCGTGQGMALSANRVEGIRAVCVGDTFSAGMARSHNDANVLTMGERVTGIGLALKIVDEFIEKSFEGGRHERRVDMLMSIK